MLNDDKVCLSGPVFLFSSRRQIVFKQNLLRQFSLRSVVSFLYNKLLISISVLSCSATAGTETKHPVLGRRPILFVTWMTTMTRVCTPFFYQFLQTNVGLECLLWHSHSQIPSLSFIHQSSYLDGMWPHMLRRP